MNVFCIISLIGIVLVNSKSESKGCTGKYLLPNNPFVIIWNHPTTQCENKGIHLNFEKWGIVDNEKDRFIGEQISLFYNLGQFPHFNNNSSINGGLPQLGNLTLHLNKVEQDIKSTMGKSFNGLAVIDFENWRPLFELNFGTLSEYKDKSVELAKKEHPSFSKDEIIKIAIKEFEVAARSFISKTLDLSVSLQPDARWGFYGYPRCWTNDCHASTVSINDRLNYIWTVNTGLYPSIYFTLDWSPASRQSKVVNTLKESLRVKATWSPQDTPILPYTFTQEDSYRLFNTTDLFYAIRLPADVGASGSVLWGSSSYMQAKNECQILQDYINTTLGPYSLDVSNFFKNCSAENCNYHGRCMKKEYEAFYQHHLRKSGRSECYIMDEYLMSPGTTFPYKNSFREQSFQETEEDFILDWQSIYEIEILTEMKSLTSKEHEEILKIPTKKNGGGHLVYDYGEYVCKCLDGYSGIHCENRAVQLHLVTLTFISVAYVIMTQLI